MKRQHGGHAEKKNQSAAPVAALLAGLLLALLTTSVAQVSDAEAAVDRRAMSIQRGDKGFPIWYQDARGTRLGLCLAGPPLCLATRGGLRPPNGEAFWWNAEAQMARVGFNRAGQARLVLAVEAAYANAGANSQISFGRIRVRANNLRPGTVYGITHPYGRLRARTDARGELRVSSDVGCAATPCRFGLALRSRVFQGFLRWDPRVGPKAPPNFLGNPTIPHKVVGSPRGTNFFRIQGPNVGGQGVDKKQTGLFSVQGRRES